MKYLKPLSLIFIVCLAFNCLADSLSNSPAPEVFVRPVRWLWFAIAGFVAAFVVAKIINKRNQRKK